MAKRVVISLFDNEAAADSAAVALKESGVAEHDAIGVLALDEGDLTKARSGMGRRRLAPARQPSASAALPGPKGAAASPSPRDRRTVTAIASVNLVLEAGKVGESASRRSDGPWRR